MSDDVEPPPPPIPPDFYPLGARSGFMTHIGPLYRRPADRALGFRVQPQHTNGMLNSHGGMLMSFADMSWGHIVSVETSSFWVTIRLTCDFLSSARLGEWIEGNSEILSREGDLFITRGRVWCGDRLLMTGTGVFKALKKREPLPGEKAYRADATG